MDVDVAKQGREQMGHGLGVGKDLGLGEHRVCGTWHIRI